MNLLPLLRGPDLQILHLEDDPHDATLVQSTLAAASVGCIVTRVQTRAEYAAALDRGGFDLILSDYSLPGFDGLSAIALARERRPNTPVILVSGTLGEELAIESLKSGATDYVLKQRLSRLAPAVRRAMQEVAARAERVRLEAQFIEAQKMEVIGQLASGIAHDFNNILAVIFGYSDLIISELGADSPSGKHAYEIRHASERAAGLTRQLLVFSRKQKVLPVVLDLNEVVQNLEGMLRRLIDENIELTIVPGDHLGRIRADAGYLGQVVMNLVVNARDAMPSGGRLTIALGNITLAAPTEGARGGPAGDYVMLRITDTGTGMEPEVKGRLFEAFFTTKTAGKGTGLGLATCQTIVQQCGGHIRVQSEVGVGSSFTVCFPRVFQPLAETARPDVSRPLRRGTETLLVVEDEPSVRQLACSVLQSLGYEVLSASNGQDALHVAREHGGSRISLVVTDVVMPLMGGKMMADWLRALHPNLKILFTSGYTDEAIASQGGREPGIEFLPKPYSPSMLADKVRAMLDTRPEEAGR